MNDDSPPQITLWHRTRAKHSRWKRIGTANGYAAAIDLGEQAGRRGGKWWFDDRNKADQENANDERDSTADAA